MISKRYKDIFERYIHRGEPTPLTIGTLVVCALCFLIIIVATFTQISFSHPWVGEEGTKEVLYNPMVPAMIFIIYILGVRYSLLTFGIYLAVGLFGWPVFVYGGGPGYIQNYFFGYFLGFVLAILISGTIFNINRSIKTRLMAALFGVLSIHIFGLAYSVILAIFKVIDFNLIIPIVNAVSISKIIYDVLFSFAVVLLAPYVKNILWICMKPKADKLKNVSKRNKIICDDVYQHRQNYN